MNCPYRSDETAGLLLDYTAHRLDAENMAMIERHLESCTECASLGLAQSAVWDALDAWDPPPVSGDFNRLLWQRIDASKAAPWYRRLAVSMNLPGWKPGLSLAAAIIVVGAGFVLDHRNERKVIPDVSAGERVSASEAEQMEQTLEDLQLLHQFDSSTAGPKQM